MSDKIILDVLSVNISEKKGTIKKPVEKIELFSEGVKKDAHSGKWHRQVSLLGQESFEKFSIMAGRLAKYGEFAENITTKGFLLYKSLPLDKFINENIELEVTQIGKKCHGEGCAIYKEVGNCVMPKEGIFCRVIKNGEIKAGEKLEYYPKVFKVKIITLSDRAFEGIYSDRSGPKIKEILENFFTENLRKHDISIDVIPDNEEILNNLIKKSINEEVDILITTGGTGIGLRDITPDVVSKYIQKEIPGIMDLIRYKFGSEKPAALISRSIAGINNKTQIYALPGSVKAVEEYMSEIQKHILHLIYMLNGLDIH